MARAIADELGITGVRAKAIVQRVLDGHSRLMGEVG